jgi:Flp pilus assembly protein TadG
MRGNRRETRRRGSVLPLIVICLVGLCGFVAFTIDVGLIAAAKTQCQNAADTAALTGARTIDGSPSGNISAATTNAVNAAMANQVLGQAVQSSDVTIQHGAYHYDPATQTFSPQFPPVAPDNYNLTKATVTHTVNYAFARVFNLTSINVSATAISTHRPRDTCILIDFSGSMNNESDLWQTESYLGTGVDNMSQNTDPVFPQWGHYDTNWSPLANLQCTSGDPRVGKCNITQSVLGIPALVNDFYQNARGASAAAAFTPASPSVTNFTPGGDAAQNQVKHVKDIPGGPPFKGYKATYGTFYGYQQGPGYWGKTFFIWPPDPTMDTTAVPPTPNDWRKKFFVLSDGVTPLNDNTKLWSAGSGSSGGGLWNPPVASSGTVNYKINYKAILNWIKNTGPNPFPPTLRAGNVLYYDQIPSDVPASAYDHTQPNRNITDPNQRFWKEYIDFTFGCWRDPYGNIQAPPAHSCSYGGEFTCGSSTGGQYVQISGPDSLGTPDAYSKPFIDPADNPKRPRHRLWFGPMTMIQYMLDTGLLPGTANDISMVPAKLGIHAALTDIKNNHPNDLVSLLLFSRPHYSGEPAEAASFSQAQFSLSRDYTGMINALYYPPNSGTADVRPFDANGQMTPRAHGDYVANTATAHGFMLAYNQFSSNSGLRAAALGGFGRKGAQRLIILETDGMANTTPNASFTNSGAYNSYYNITPSDNFSGSDGWSAASSGAIAVAQALCAQTTASTPGYSTPSKPVIIHCVAFGAVFEAAASSASEQGNAVGLLQSISTAGGTVFPSSATDPTYGYKWCIGTLDQRKSKLRTAFSKIMDDGINVTMVK